MPDLPGLVPDGPRCQASRQKRPPTVHAGSAAGSKGQPDGIVFAACGFADTLTRADLDAPFRFPSENPEQPSARVAFFLIRAGFENTQPRVARGRKRFTDENRISRPRVSVNGCRLPFTLFSIPFDLILIAR